MGAAGKHRNVRALGVTLAAVGIAGLGMVAARQWKRRHAKPDDVDVEPGTRSVFRIVTIKAHPANVENDWNEWVETQGSDESRAATVTFHPAPGKRGTEMRAELTYARKAGRLGDVALRMAHKSPGQMLGQDLRRFKMMAETGETVKSDASIHQHMHPARPDDRLGNANLIQEEAR